MSDVTTHAERIRAGLNYEGDFMPGSTVHGNALVALDALLEENATLLAKDVERIEGLRTERESWETRWSETLDRANTAEAENAMLRAELAEERDASKRIILDTGKVVTRNRERAEAAEALVVSLTEQRDELKKRLESATTSEVDTPRMEQEFTDAELVAIARGNHQWINALALVRPSLETLAAIGAHVIACLDTSPILDDFIQCPKNVTYIRFNRS